MGAVERVLSLDEFPNPEELWLVYRRLVASRRPTICLVQMKIALRAV